MSLDSKMSGNILRWQNKFDQSNKSTLSLLESAPEDFRFSPNHDVGVRRTSSLDDISRFYRYFHLVSGNIGKLFTWQHYLKILHQQLGNLETLTILGKTMLPLVQSRQTAEELNRVSAPQTTTAAHTDKLSAELDCAWMDAVTEEMPIISSQQFDFDDACQSPGKSASSNHSTLSIMGRSRVLMKICAETKFLAQKISKTADLIARLPQNCSECGTSLEGIMHKQNCTQNIETGGDTAGNVEDIKVEDQSEAELSDFTPMGPFQLPTFSGKPSTGAGESTLRRLPLTKTSPCRRRSLRRLARMCKQYITRR